MLSLLIVVTVNPAKPSSLLPIRQDAAATTLLDKYGTEASRQEYARFLGEWEVAGRRLPAQDVEASDLTISELILAFWRHAEEYYGFKKVELPCC